MGTVETLIRRRLKVNSNSHDKQCFSKFHTKKMLIKFKSCNKTYSQQSTSGCKTTRSRLAQGNCCQYSLDWCRRKWGGPLERWVFTLVLHYVFPQRQTDIFSSLSSSCTACFWRQQPGIWLHARVTLQPGLMQCLLGHRRWKGWPKPLYQLSLHICYIIIVYVRISIRPNDQHPLKNQLLQVWRCWHWWQNNGWFSTTFIYSIYLIGIKWFFFLKTTYRFVSPVGRFMSCSGRVEEVSRTATWWIHGCTTDSCSGTNCLCCVRRN